MKRFLYAFFGFIVLCLILIELTGNQYLYKTFAYNFVGIDDYQLFENRTIKAGEAQPWPKADNFNQITMPDSLANLLEELKTIGLVVVKDGELIYENYPEEYGYSNTSLSNSFSMAKSMISLLIGIAIEEGAIASVDQKVSDFIPEYRVNGLKDLTFKNLLIMSSGTNWSESYISPFSDVSEAYYTDDINQVILSLDREEPQGQNFKYKSGDTQILAYALSKATGETIADYFSQKIWSKIGAEHDAIWCLDHENGMEKSYCCINSNARDFARLGQLMLQKGKWNGEQLIPEKWIEESLQPAKTIDKFDREVDFYGYQWWLIPEEKAYYARGILGQYIIVMPEEDIVICRLGKKRGEKVDEKHQAETLMMIRTFRNLMKE